MCERNDTPGNDDSLTNQDFVKFKKNLSENNFKSQCRKCNNPGYVLLQKRDVYCSDCLRDYCIQKFRVTIGKNRIVKNGDQVLLAISGGVGSTAMLEMVKACANLPDVHKRIRYVPSILYIHEGLFNFDQRRIRNELFNFLTGSTFTCYFTTLEQILNSSGPEFLKLDADSLAETSLQQVNEFFSQSQVTLGEKLANIFNNLKSLSSKQDFLSKLRPLIMSKIASNLGIEKIFIGSTMSELSVDLMNDMALGKGIEVHSQTSFSDDRFSPVQILRPMREFSHKEMIFYCKLQQLESVIYKLNQSTTTAMPIKSSIFKMTEFFLNNLQTDFPGTISTVFHTGSKLTSIDADSSLGRCRFCRGVLDISRGEHTEYSAYDALRLTSSLSNGSEAASTESDSTTAKKFCYSCLRLSLEIGDEPFESLLM